MLRVLVLPVIEAAVHAAVDQSFVQTAGSGAGASKVTQDVTNIIAQVPATIEALTGVDFTEQLSNLPGLKAEDSGAAAESAEGAE